MLYGQLSFFKVVCVAELVEVTLACRRTRRQFISFQCSYKGYMPDVFIASYSKTCVKRPFIDRQNKDLDDEW